jgi:hypothetical protein
VSTARSAVDSSRQLEGKRFRIFATSFGSQVEPPRAVFAMRVQNGELTVQQGIALVDRRSADALTEMKNRQFAIQQAYQAAPPPPTVNCRTWSDGAGIATQVYMSCE